MSCFGLDSKILLSDMVYYNLNPIRSWIQKFALNLNEWMWSNVKELKKKFYPHQLFSARNIGFETE